VGETRGLFGKNIFDPARAHNTLNTPSVGFTHDYSYLGHSRPKGSEGYRAVNMANCIER